MSEQSIERILICEHSPPDTVPVYQMSQQGVLHPVAFAAGQRVTTPEIFCHQHREKQPELSAAN
jgi:hypothetical protein